MGGSLMDTVTRREPWRLDARCLGTDPELFFPTGGTHIGAEARALCNVCPVRQQCLDYALANKEEHGVWGGLSGRERERLTKATPSPCGTNAGYTRHRRNHEQQCEACKAAAREYHLVNDRKRRASGYIRPSRRSAA